MATFSISTQAAGLANGTLITTSNLPPVTTVTTSATPTYAPQVSNLIPVLGATSILQGGSAASTSFLRASISGSPLTFATRFATRFSTVGSAAADWLDCRNTNASGKVFGMGINGSNQLQVKDAAGTVPSGGTWSTAVDTSKTYVVYIEGTIATTTTGSLAVSIKDTDGVTELWSYTGSAMNLGANGLSQFWLPGKQTSAPNITVAWNHWLMETGTTTRQANIARTNTVNAGPDQTVTPYSTVTLDSSGSVCSLGASSSVWSQQSGPAVTLSSTTATSPTFTAPPNLTDQTVTFRKTVTDYNLPTANTQYDDISVLIYKAMNRIMVGGVLKPAKFQTFLSA